MKLGFITAILDSWTYEEMMDFASEQGFECVEVACWPQEKAERRYAGVKPYRCRTGQPGGCICRAYRGICKEIRSGDLSTGLLSKRDGCRQKKSKAAVEHLKQVILASKKLGVGMVTTFIGRTRPKMYRRTWNW